MALVNCWLLNYWQYLDELRQDGIQMTKHAYMALVNAYSRLGNFDMAKQVNYDRWLEFSFILLHIQSFHVSILLTHDALLLFLIRLDRLLFVAT
jgi:hypothetical protein